MLTLWFNKANASSTFGTRVTSRYFALSNEQHWFWTFFTGGDWGPSHTTNATVVHYGMLADYYGQWWLNETTRMFSTEIPLLKAWAKVTRGPHETNATTQIRDIRVFDLTFDSNMQGIPTPAFEESQLPTIKPRGLLGVIYSALMWLGEKLGVGILNFWYTLVSWLDSIALWFGYPNFFSNLFSYLGTLWGWFVNSFTYLLSFLTQGFLFVFSFIGKLLNTLTTVVMYWIQIIQGIFAFLDGAYTSGIHIWNDLGLSYWVILIAILYPVFVFSIWDEKGFDAMLSHIKLVLDILSWIGKLFLTVINLFLNLIGRIIESIPVVE